MSLSDDKKTRLREIDTELAKLKLTYGENVLAETNNYHLHITNEDDLKGLPDDAKEMAQSLAKSRNARASPVPKLYRPFLSCFVIKKYNTATTSFT